MRISLPKTHQRFAALATFMAIFTKSCRQASSTSSSSRVLAAFGFVQRQQGSKDVTLGTRSWRSLQSSAGDHIGADADPRKEESTIDEKHKKSYRIQGSTSESSRAGVRARTGTGHVLHTDLPRPMGGADRAAQPVETLLAALAGCTQATAMYVARNLRPVRLDVRRIDFDLRAARDERGALALPIESPPEIPSRLRFVSGTVRVHAANSRPISDRDLALLREQTELRCPVANMMVASGCEMNVRWVDGSDDKVEVSES